MDTGRAGMFGAGPIRSKDPLMRFLPFTAVASVVCTAATGLSLLFAAPATAALPPATPVAAEVHVEAQAEVHVAVPAPRVPRGLPSSIEPLAAYVGQDSCDPFVRRGTRELAQLLAHTYRSYSATSWASTYACGTDGTQSEHYDGRAIDWMVSVQNKRQHAAAQAFLAWLLASDKAGNRFAMARRLGVMYVILSVPKSPAHVVPCSGVHDQQARV